jgi:hypothetical protein
VLERTFRFLNFQKLFLERRRASLLQQAEQIDRTERSDASGEEVGLCPENVRLLEKWLRAGVVAHGSKNLLVSVRCFQAAVWLSAREHRTGKDRAESIARALRDEINLLNWAIRILLRLSFFHDFSLDRIKLERPFFETHGLGRPPNVLAWA